MLGNVKRPYKKRLEPDTSRYIFWNYDVTPFAGQIVTVLQHNGPFRTIRTEDGHYFYGIGRGLLKPVK